MLDTNYHDKQAWFYRFSNVAEYYAEASKTSDLPNPSSRSVDSYHGSSWSGTSTFEEMQERYTKGFRQGTEDANKLVLKLTPFLRTVVGTKRGWKPQRYAGGNFILSNYVRGIPEVSNVMSPVISKKFASLVLNGVASSGVSSEVMQRRGIACVAIAQVLETNGYRVSIKMAYGISGDPGKKQITVIDLKPFHQTMDIDRIAFFLSDPSAFRRLYFSFMENRSEVERKAMHVVPTGNYGTPCELPASEIGEKDIYLGCASFHNKAWHSLESTQAWIKETLRRYGIEFHGGAV